MQALDELVQGVNQRGLVVVATGHGQVAHVVASRGAYGEVQFIDGDGLAAPMAEFQRKQAKERRNCAHEDQSWPMANSVERHQSVVRVHALAAEDFRTREPQV